MALLKKFETDFGTIRVTRFKRDGSLAYYQNGCFHSQANRKGISICGYVHVIQEVIRQSHARNILIIGCAGGTLATMLRHLKCRVTVVDINPMAFVIARRYFSMPDDVRCVRRDGIAYLRTTRKYYDAVVIDVFGANNAVPPKFVTKDFFKSVRNILSHAGIMVMNVMTMNDEDTRADGIARNAQNAGMDVTLFDWPSQKDRNTLIVGDMRRYVHIPSGHEPSWIQDDLSGIIRRQPRRRVHNL